MSEVMILCYHAISPTWDADLSVTPEAFERQITTLARAGWSSATFTEAITAPAASRTLAVTFDDAFDSVRTYALPVLERVGFRATMFAPSGYVTRGAPLAWEGMAHWPATEHAPELAPMRWDQLGELVQHGWEVGSHTRNHPHLTTLDDGALRDEILGSAQECAEHLGAPVTSLAYPYGDVDDRVIAVTREAGYTTAAALEWPSPRSGLHRWPRIGIYHNDSTARFRLKTAGWSRSRLGARLLALRG